MVSMHGIGKMLECHLWEKKFIQKKSLKKHVEYQVCLLKTISEKKKYLCREKECKNVIYHSRSLWQNTWPGTKGTREDRIQPQQWDQKRVRNKGRL